MSTEIPNLEPTSVLSLNNQWDALRFGVMRSVRYHRRRRCFFERIGVLTNFLTVFSGACTGVSALVGIQGPTTAILGFLTALFSSADLIIGYSGKARDYHELARSFIDLEREMVLVGDRPSDQDLIRIRSKRLEIEADEPPKLAVLDIVCHNEVTRALDLGEEHMLKIPFFKRLLCHLHDFDSSSFQSLKLAPKSGLISSGKP